MRPLVSDWVTNGGALAAIIIAIPGVLGWSIIREHRKDKSR